MKPKSAKEYWKEKFGEYPQNDSEKLAIVMMQEYASSRDIDWQKLRNDFFTDCTESQEGVDYWTGANTLKRVCLAPHDLFEWFKTKIQFRQPAVNGELPGDYEPYFGWCDIDGCENEGCSGGIAWSDTGYWTVCSEHSQIHREGKKQPKMKQKAIDREKTRKPDRTLP